LMDSPTFAIWLESSQIGSIAFITNW
jgi:hypothetical protein